MAHANQPIPNLPTQRPLDDLGDNCIICCVKLLEVIRTGAIRTFIPGAPSTELALHLERAGYIRLTPDFDADFNLAFFVAEVRR